MQQTKLESFNKSVNGLIGLKQRSPNHLVLIIVIGTSMKVLFHLRQGVFTAAE